MRTRLLASLGFLALFLTALASDAAAQTPLRATPTHERIQVREYLFPEAGMEIEYQLYVPTGYDPATPAPLLVWLHGLGSNPGQVIRYQGVTDEAEARGYIVAAPMGFNSRGWYGSRGTGRASDRGEAANDPDNLGELSERDVMNVLTLTLAEFNIDPDRVYLAGHSMGGGGTWHIALKYPGIWAGLGPVAPAIYTSPEALSAIQHLPVIVIQGDNDNLVSVDATRQWVAQMEALGMAHRYIEISGGDHTAIISRTPQHIGAIFDFFDAARRD